MILSKIDPQSYIILTRSTYKPEILPNIVLLSLAILYVLKLTTTGSGGFVHFGLKCSSLVLMNRATSGRTACSSVGNADFPSVSYSNKLLERSLRSSIVVYIRGQLRTHKILSKPIYSFNPPIQSLKKPIYTPSLLKDNPPRNAGHMPRCCVDPGTAHKFCPGVLPHVAILLEQSLGYCWTLCSLNLKRRDQTVK